MEPLSPQLYDSLDIDADIDTLLHFVIDSYPLTNLDLDVVGDELDVSAQQQQQQQLLKFSHPTVTAASVSSVLPSDMTPSIHDNDLSYSSILSGAYSQDIYNDALPFVDLPNFSEIFTTEYALPSTLPSTVELPLNFNDAAFITALLEPQTSLTAFGANLVNAPETPPNNGIGDHQSAAVVQVDSLGSIQDYHMPHSQASSTHQQASLSSDSPSFSYQISPLDATALNLYQVGEVVPDVQFPEDTMPVDNSGDWQLDSTLSDKTNFYYPLLLTRGVNQSVLDGSLESDNILPSPIIPLGEETPRTALESCSDTFDTYSPIQTPATSFTVSPREIFYSPQQVSSSPVSVNDTISTPYYVSESMNVVELVAESRQLERTPPLKSVTDTPRVSASSPRGIQSPSQQSTDEPSTIQSPSSPSSPSSIDGADEPKGFKAMQSRNSFILFRSLVSFVHTKVRGQNGPGVKQTDLSNALGKLWVKHHPVNPRHVKSGPDHFADGCADCAVKELFATASMRLAERDTAIFESAVSSTIPPVSFSPTTKTYARSIPRGSSTPEPNDHHDPMDALDWALLERHHRDSTLLAKILDPLRCLKGFPKGNSSAQTIALLKGIWRQHEIEHEQNRRDDIMIKVKSPKTTSELTDLLADNCRQQGPPVTGSVLLDQ